MLREGNVEDFPGRDPWVHALLAKGMVGAAKAVLPHVDLSATDSSGRHVLQVAVASGDSELCTLVLQRAEASSDAAFPADVLKASINEAIKRGHPEISRLLIEVNADVAAHALVDAISRQDDVVSTTLLECGAPIDVPVQMGSTSRTALHCCASKPTLLARILSLVVDVDVRDSNGQTALSLAAASGNLAACEMLLKKGALLQLKAGPTGTLANVPRVCTRTKRYHSPFHLPWRIN
ncbi:hypothetical protein PINS_up002416 [Pythium insidiosum]|nr:hypothetical protein PINS_up002416 [Pythium insidiosum]